MGTRGAAPPAVASGAPPSPRIQGKGPGPAPRCRGCRAGGPGARPGGGLRARGPSQRVAVPRRGRGAPGQSTGPLLSPGAAGPCWAELVSLFPPVRVGIGGAARSPSGCPTLPAAPPPGSLPGTPERRPPRRPGAAAASPSSGGRAGELSGNRLNQKNKGGLGPREESRMGHRPRACAGLVASRFRQY
ncbi:PREDICTED: translation initiation factor IF-2-like [Rhinopithecus bieti]|uniref:translation initiation factor IF-2-like n=1 Tax=Rhinopithecus bieti TaxID=61621 RepID=UPI00083BAB73|nr:PREDICTED: translation initiation factor IF-2-like [Rhinopithecus bieti]